MMGSNGESHANKEAEGLQSVRSKRRLFVAALLGYLAVGAVLVRMHAPFELALLILVPLLLLAFALSIVVSTARCPRCGQFFHGRFSHSLFRRRCRYCQYGGEGPAQAP